LLVLALLASTSSPGAQRPEYAKNIATLIEPAKLATMVCSGPIPGIRQPR
jgi:hypothetical protein